jgi:hypothetical protein
MFASDGNATPQPQKTSSALGGFSSATGRSIKPPSAEAMKRALTLMADVEVASSENAPAVRKSTDSDFVPPTLRKVAVVQTPARPASTSPAPRSVTTSHQKTRSLMKGPMVDKTGTFATPLPMSKKQMAAPTSSKRKFQTPFKEGTPRQAMRYDTLESATVGIPVKPASIPLFSLDGAFLAMEIYSRCW